MKGGFTGALADVAGSYTIANVGTSPMLIMADTAGGGRYLAPRPVIRGSGSTPALIINRPNVTVRGLVVEMGSGSTAPAIRVSNNTVVLDANIFRPSAANVSVATPAITLNNNAQAVIQNNFVWGFGAGVQFANSPSPLIRIVNNTFMLDAGLPAGTNMAGMRVENGDVTAIIANNFFSGISNPYDITLANTQPKLSRNVYTIDNVNYHGFITKDTQLAKTIALAPINMHASNFLDLISTRHTQIGSPFDCNANTECTSLFAGSDRDASIGPPSRDLFGKLRINHPEVGAFEFENPNPNAVVSWLKFEATMVENDFTRATYQVSSTNVDTLDADSVKVWWAETQVNDPAGSGVLGRKTFPSRQLLAGTIIDTATGLKEKTTYFFRAAFFKGTNRGHTVTRSLESGILKSTEPCDFAISNTRCPSTDGVFQANGGFSTWVTSVVTLREAAAGGSRVEVPVFASSQAVAPSGMQVSDIPAFTLNIKEDNLGKQGSSQTFTAIIDLDSTQIDARIKSNSLDLFLLGQQGGLPALVTSWESSIENGKTQIRVEGNQGGALTYVFGKLPSSSVTLSTLAPTEPVPFLISTTSPPPFDITFSGTNFKTANPLVLAAVVPAGAYMDSSVFVSTYFAKSQLLTSGFSNLPDSLKNSRFMEYFKRMVRADSGSEGNTPGMKNPFRLRSISENNFPSIISLGDGGLTIGADGSLAPTTVSIEVGQNYPSDGTARKRSRSLEVVIAVFDGSAISFGRAFVRTSFKELHTSETRFFENTGKWNLISLPWEEKGYASLAGLVGRKDWIATNFKAMRYNGQGSAEAGYTLYKGGATVDFPFSGGKAIWVGGNQPFRPAPEEGVSLDSGTYALNLRANLWNDIGLPFNFPMLWQDILTASGLTAEQIPAFRYNSATPAWEALAASSVVNPWEGITVKPSSAVALKFPVVDTARSVTVVAKQSANDAWRARIKVFNSSAGMELQIGTGKNESRLISPPLVPGQNFGLFLKNRVPGASAEALSRHIRADGEHQGVWPLEAHLWNKTEGVSFRLEDAVGPEIPVYLVEALENRVIPLSKDSEIRLSGSDFQDKEYYLVAGNEAYLQSVVNKLHPSGFLSLTGFPNPFTRSVQLRYALPGSVVSAQYHVRAFNYSGKEVWDARVKGNNILEISWNGVGRDRMPVPPGAYTISVEAVANNGKRFTATRKLLRF